MRLVASRLIVCWKDLESSKEHLQGKMRSRLSSNIAIGIVVALGIWNRIDFVAFAVPSGVALLFADYYVWKRSKSTKLLALPLAWEAIAFGTLALILSALDTAYFQPHHLFTFPPQWVLTPLNSLLYNLRSENLALHGTHPRWLHAVVNWPMMFGVGYIATIAHCWTLFGKSGWSWSRASPSERLQMRA